MRGYMYELLRPRGVYINTISLTESRGNSLYYLYELEKYVFKRAKNAFFSKSLRLLVQDIYLFPEDCQIPLDLSLGRCLNRNFLLGNKKSRRKGWREFRRNYGDTFDFIQNNLDNGASPEKISVFMLGFEDRVRISREEGIS